MIRLAKGVDLPASAATQTFAFMGKRGSGKTYAAGVLVEGLHRAGAQVVIVDPVGSWWGLRLAADGKAPGLPIPVLGGLHGDLKLTPESGSLIADMVVDTGTSVVLDVMEMRKAERRRFVTAFAEQLFHRKKTSRSPIHIVLEESHLFVPQRTMPGDEPMLGAMEDLIKLGRNYGIGVSLLDQRPQSVNKDALNQSEILLAFQLIGSHERKAVTEWAEDKGIGKGDTKRLSTLEQGQAFLWSPSWLKRFEVVKIGTKTTFDASSTPEVGGAQKTRRLAPVDLLALEGAMALVTAETQANDPARLKRRIAELGKELAAAQAVTRAAAPDLRRLRDALEEVSQQSDVLAEAIGRAEGECDRLERGEPKTPARASNPLPPELLKRARERIEASVNKSTPLLQMLNGKKPNIAFDVSPGREDGGKLGKGPGTFLGALATAHPRPMSKTEVSVLAGYSPRSSTVRNILSKLRTLHLISDGAGGIRLTPEGVEAAGPVERPRSPDEMLALWRPQIGKGPGDVLRLLIDVYPDQVNKEMIEEVTGYSATSSTMRNILSKLRSTGLAVGSGGLVQASEAVMNGGR